MYHGKAQNVIMVDANDKNITGNLADIGRSKIMILYQKYCNLDNFLFISKFKKIYKQQQQSKK
jgi:hypothetical protein